jgi:hypothetical protein
MTSPKFIEIVGLPSWIINRTKDCYFNNLTITPKDILMLKFISTSPNFEGSKRYDSYKFIQLTKADSFDIKVNLDRKDMIKYGEKEIHFRRVIGLRIVISTIEVAQKKGFRTGAGSGTFSPTMIGLAKTIPNSTKNFLQWKIKLIEIGKIKSNLIAQKKLCQFRKRAQNICPACTIAST